MRDAERKKLVSELQMVRDRAHEMNLRLSEAQAEAEHARETVSVEAAEKDRLNGEVAYLRGELERLRATHETETSDFTDWRSQTERQEKELSRELHEAPKRRLARHALDGAQTRATDRPRSHRRGRPNVRAQDCTIGERVRDESRDGARDLVRADACVAASRR